MPQKNPSKESTVRASEPSSTLSNQPSSSRNPFVISRTVGAKAPRKVANEEGSEDEYAKQRPRGMPLGSSKPMKRPKVERHIRDSIQGLGTAEDVQCESTADAARRKDAAGVVQCKSAIGAVHRRDTTTLVVSEPVRSFMEDMPGRIHSRSSSHQTMFISTWDTYRLTLPVLPISVSPPDSPTLAACVQSSTWSDFMEESKGDQVLDTKPRDASPGDDSLLPDATTTPQRDTATPTNTTPQRPADKSSPFRTPPEKSRHTHGLSPNESVFWARTPPSEALRRLGRVNSGRSHEDGTYLSMVRVRLAHDLNSEHTISNSRCGQLIDGTCRNCINCWSSLRDILW